ncbi:MAG: succinate dehydrogenase, hydrophobic membrane anchor protein [Beijerinckiaceae bacterium]
MSNSPSSMRTPLSKVRGLGSAKSGTEHFWLQRVTALANVVLAFAFIFLVVSLIGRDYEDALDLLSRPVPAALLALFVISGVIHMRLGMQVVIEDYVHGEGAKVLALILNTFFCVAIGALCLIAILKLAVGA